MYELLNVFIGVCDIGYSLINGDHTTGDLFKDAIMENQPVVIFKNTGYTADIAAEMMDVVLKHVKKKKKGLEFAEGPYPDAMASSYVHPGWLKPFDTLHKRDCKAVNILCENWPDGFNETSVFTLDMFGHSEDDMQDYLTKTMAVAFEGGGDMGSSATDNKRLTFAWRLRYKLLYNAARFHRQSNVLMFWFTVITLLSTWAAVLYTYVLLQGDEETLGMEKYDELALDILLKANMLLPLIATVLRGIFSVVSPLNKYNVLKDGAAAIESEIYMYRTGVGKYNPRKPVESLPSESGGDVEQNNTTVPTSPRVIFSNALDAIMAHCSEGELRNASVDTPKDLDNILVEVNDRLISNREEQDAYIHSLERKNTGVLSLFGCFGGASQAAKKQADLVAAKRSAEKQKKRKLYGKAQEGGNSWSITRYLSCAFGAKVAPVSDNEHADSGGKTHEDGLSKLSADEYVKLRLLPAMGQISAKTPKISASVYATSITVTVISVSSSALSTFGLSVFIPAALAFAGALTSWGDFQRNEQRLLQKNIALSKMRSVSLL